MEAPTVTDDVPAFGRILWSTLEARRETEHHTSRRHAI
jgi:hypothetical protein